MNVYRLSKTPNTRVLLESLRFILVLAEFNHKMQVTIEQL